MPTVLNTNCQIPKKHQNFPCYISWTKFLIVDKNAFRVSFRNAKDGQSHTLQANDEHDKRQWVTCIKGVLEKYGSTEEGPGSASNSQDPSEVGTVDLYDFFKA